jgi:DNA-binding NtrC family response regulator
VILDIWMQGSGMDGLELLDLVKALDADLPVIMISGHGNIETAVQRDQARRLRLHREAVQVRPAAADRGARAGGRPA